jgi:hypothetical protein
MKKLLIPALLLLTSILLITCKSDRTAESNMISDTLYIREVTDLPVIDGLGDDSCWENIEWLPIDQVWMPWGDTVDSTDFYGRYKLAWSGQENLIYVLLEIRDNVWSVAFEPGVSAKIYNFDMFEVFIDEDHSGGTHVFDGTGTIDSVYGKNGENAFGYHILTLFRNGRADREASYFNDLAGTCWDSALTVDYRDHFDEFEGIEEGTLHRWEFSLKVYDDSFEPNGDHSDSRVRLYAGKIMGLTLAYNDDDDPETDPAESVRDNFFGSVAVEEEAWNDHWMNADDFRVVKLIDK